MDQLMSSLGSFVVILLIASIAILLVLSLLTPLFIFLINRNVRELLKEQQTANEELAENMDKITEKLKNISKAIRKKKVNLSQIEENQEQNTE
jgi:uncharacterized protein HemX